VGSGYESVPRPRRVKTMKCSRCGWEMERSLWKVPHEIPNLAKKLGMPGKELRSLIDEDKIPLRVRVDKLARQRGLFVLIRDVLDGIRELRSTWN